jgi:hypothetical protein
LKGEKQMNRMFYTMLTVVLVLAIGLIPVLAFAADYDSPSNVTTLGENTLAWTGQGTYIDEESGDRVLNNVLCEAEGEEGLPPGVAPGDAYLMWVFTFDGATLSGTPTLTVNGVDQPAGTQQGNNYQFVTSFFALDTLEAYVTFTVASLPAHGPNNPPSAQMVLTISHGCPGDGGQAQATLSVVKFYDGNANGEWDALEPLLDGWYFTIDGTLYSTPFSEIVDAGVYNITELMPDEPNWVASNITVVGTESYTINSNTEVEVTLEDEDIVTVYFGNYCLVPSGGFTPGYWSQVVMSKGRYHEPIDSRRISAELYADFYEYIHDLNPVTFVNNDGSPASFSNALTLSEWFGSGLNAANMAAQLSRHTAAMILNILSGAVDGNAYYIPAEMTVQEIVDASKALLNANPIITEPGELRDQAEQLKDWLDELNNGADVVPSEHCPYTFTLPE